IPLGFISSQDQGVLVLNIQLPDSASLERTEAVNAKIEKIALAHPGVAHTLGIPGTPFVINANSSNFGSMFLVLKPFPKRHDSDLGADAIAAQLRRTFQQEIPEGRINI